MNQLNRLSSKVLGWLCEKTCPWTTCESQSECFAQLWTNCPCDPLALTRCHWLRVHLHFFLPGMLLRRSGEAGAKYSYHVSCEHLWMNACWLAINIKNHAEFLNHQMQPPATNLEDPAQSPCREEGAPSWHPSSLKIGHPHDPQLWKSPRTKISSTVEKR